MMHSILSLLCLAIGLASAQLYSRSNTTSSTCTHKLLIGASGQLLGLDFNGTRFTGRANANNSEPGKSASWLTFKEPNLLYAVNENTNATRLFNYDPQTGALSNETATFNGSAGVVHLTFTADKKRLIGSSYGQGQIDIWDSSAENGMLKLLKQIPLEGEHGPDLTSQTQLRAHQSLIDPTGRFLLVNDLGGDLLHIFDLSSDTYRSPSAVKTTNKCGPRHGTFLQLDGGKQATHYLVVCEISNMLLLYSVSYADAVVGLTFKKIDTKSTFGLAFPPANATAARAGELVVSKSGRVYISNRLTGNDTDSISHFALEATSKNDTTAQLVFKGQVSGGGIAPRMMSLSKDESIMFVTNVNGENGLVALKRDTVTGMLEEKPLAVMRNTEFAPGQPVGEGFGPMFVTEI